ncbi:sulfotransferase [Actinomadura fulvescens]|uniref:sulfotransferase family protein n=1 Tax=Actinomadura fulvescens TaxID=46160 RepID=UPI00397E007B
MTPFFQRPDRETEITQLRPRLRKGLATPASTDAEFGINEDARRLVRSPVFIFSAFRSGSTLLRCILDTHSCVHSPPEMHLDGMNVRISGRSAKDAVPAMGMIRQDLDNLLWDALLYRSLVRSGKKILVEKTPDNVRMWRRISTHWPEARYIFLLRNPLNILDSMRNWRGRPSRLGRIGARLCGYHWMKEQYLHHWLLPLLTDLAEARASLPGITIRYEQLTTDPHGTMQAVCKHLDIPWEPQMLNYGRVPHGAFGLRLGDTSERIRSGRILADRSQEPLKEIAKFRRISAILGYPSQRC